MGYREDFFKENKGIKGKYRCVRCGKWYPKSEIDVDHIIPQKYGGPDHLANLQAMCKHCNRSKGADLSNTVTDLVKHNAKRTIKNLFK